MKKLIESNYQSIVDRGLITPSTTLTDFIDKIYEEVAELEEVSESIRDFDKLKEELSDVILTCLNMAFHYQIDIETEMKKKIDKNFERSKN